MSPTEYTSMRSIDGKGIAHDDHEECAQCGARMPWRNEKARAKHLATHDTPVMTDTTAPLSRYELLRDDPRFGLSKGDILICEPMHWAWADEKVAVVRRESDGFDPGCSQYRHDVRHVSGPKS